MKKIYFATTLLFGVASYSQFTVDFEDLSLSGQQTYWNGSDGTGDFTSGGLTFTNVYNTSWEYWESGFAYSNQVSDTMTGLNGQYSSYADGGVGGNGIYAIAQNGVEISLMPQNAVPYSISISNTNYAAHSMLNGDQFAKKFGGSTGDDPDWFLLTIYGYQDLDTIPDDSTSIYLADYRFSDNSQDYILKNWTTVDLSMFLYFEKISFALSSSDENTWGINTPAFFAIDNLSWQWAESVKENELNFDIYPNPAASQLYIRTEIGQYKYEVLSLDGKSLMKGTNASYPLNIEDLAKGSYWIRLTSEEGTNTQQFIKW